MQTTPKWAVAQAVTEKQHPPTQGMTVRVPVKWTPQSQLHNNARGLPRLHTVLLADKLSLFCDCFCHLQMFLEILTCRTTAIQLVMWLTTSVLLLWFMIQNNTWKLHQTTDIWYVMPSEPCGLYWRQSKVPPPPKKKKPTTNFKAMCLHSY